MRSDGCGDSSAQLCNGLDAYQIAVDHMQAARLRFRVFQPQVSGARIFSKLDRTGARFAADRRIAFVVPRVVQHVFAANVLPDIVFRPASQGIEFLHTVRGIVFLYMQLGAGLRLRAALTGNSHQVASQDAIERLGLAGAAALFFMHLDAVVKHIQAILFKIGGNDFHLRPIRRDVVIVDLLDAIKHVQRLGVQTPSFPG